jgi:hypothetical protein
VLTAALSICPEKSRYCAAIPIGLPATKILALEAMPRQNDGPIRIPKNPGNAPDANTDIAILLAAAAGLAVAQSAGRTL